MGFGFMFLSDCFAPGDQKAINITEMHLSAYHGVVSLLVTPDMWLHERSIGYILMWQRFIVNFSLAKIDYKSPILITNRALSYLIFFKMY